MNKAIFINRLKEVEIKHRSEYTQNELRYLTKDILEELHPSDREWDDAIREAASAKWFPKVSEMIRITKDVQAKTPGRGIVKTSCATCDGEGILWIRRDHPVIQEEIKSGKLTRHIGICGCGCPNTPDWHTDTRFYDGTPKKSVATMNQILHADSRFKRSDFVKRNGQRVDESDKAYAERCLADAAKYEGEEWMSKKALDVIISKISKSMTVPEKAANIGTQGEEVPF